ncbi:MAG: translation initiation factor Sui1 [Candidatus Omnitrophica bacterium]|nr:translation initiation factor Sui1 [Candidatus Omnitrophota bacterium]
MKSENSKNLSIVYSTEHGRICPNCQKSVKRCICGQKQTARKNDGVVRIGRETKGRKGKGVTVITGLPLTMDQLRETAKQLKQKCGSGGTVKEGVIEIQGDHRDAVMEELTKQGYTVKRSGG